ncbi:N-methylhydantoinase B [Paraburkholderia sp. BL27I4N3]|uniref:hydantoinase B/oxoprolinase family protein n=1 Tax=Paraburkholderia sp. BL27I4N3 TaxID=1938805 RepID=UPI000E275307|nr:hydantoinase B/oxoprolinase family protein [Paraburkholderia sp. BL27I4N3]REE21729.1 N-methylhydantoinase B [Paraburkholderia sp. BL27I4N3]
MAIDRRNLQVLANYCAAAADAMAYTLLRTAYSTFVKETEDFSCTILTESGMAFANPRSFGAPWYSGIDYAPVIEMFDDYEDGDVCITNDSYSGHVATHSPDIHIWKPVFDDGVLVCFVAGHIHNTDVGGAVPASLSRSLTDIVQEGIRIPPVKIYRRGVLNEEMAAMMRLNVRAPDQNWGDFNAQIASVNIGERKVKEIIARFGREDFKEGARAILDHAEQQARNVIRTIPDGEYFFADYADEDGDGGVPCRIALTLRVKGDEVELDYTGSDPQLASSLNMPTGGREHHPLPLVGLTYVLYTLDPRIWMNAGTLRAARAILPSGTVVNCEAPAAVGMRSLTCMMTQIVTFGAFSLALPDRIPVTAPGGNAIMNVKTVDHANRPVMASIGPVGGGGGATPISDGVEGCGGASAFLKNTPIEISEAEVPIFFLRYGLWPDTAGAGQYRGGMSTVMEFRASTPNTIVTARNRNRSVFSSWGVKGGRAGALSTFQKNPDTSDAMELGNTDVVRCDPGDVIRVIGPGAGGYGDPMLRDAQRVLSDVRSGFLSPERALEDYGVAVKGTGLHMCIDQDLTATHREKRRGVAGGHEHFDYGPTRSAFEQRWTRDRYDEMTTFLASLPVAWRHFIKRQIFMVVDAQTGMSVDLRTQMQEIFSAIRSKYPALTPRPE